ncbi:hypothetical protein DEO72_LG3g1435 [Vigna unguiculata]|uniref:Uncharacterized protein n=1 Tax=Vigna unguiculata TaxID=3917 RepID=A0A4D6LEQ9_VIGUN|nr:hypothetical protein DEO72_LG3g1435 [Vigna unguiculata]
MGVVEVRHVKFMSELELMGHVIDMSPWGSLGEISRAALQWSGRNSMAPVSGCPWWCPICITSSGVSRGIHHKCKHPLNPTKLYLGAEQRYPPQVQASAESDSVIHDENIFDCMMNMLLALAYSFCCMVVMYMADLLAMIINVGFLSPTPASHTTSAISAPSSLLQFKMPRTASRRSSMSSAPNSILNLNLTRHQNGAAPTSSNARSTRTWHCTRTSWSWCSPRCPL